MDDPKTTEKQAELPLPETSATATEPPQESILSLADARIGYIIALKDDGSFIWETFGKDKGLIQLLGIHQEASKRVETIYAENRMSGDRLLAEVGNAVMALNQKFDKLIASLNQLVAPKKPNDIG